MGDAFRYDDRIQNNQQDGKDFKAVQQTTNVISMRFVYHNIRENIENPVFIFVVLKKGQQLLL